MDGGVPLKYLPGLSKIFIVATTCHHQRSTLCAEMKAAFWMDGLKICCGYGSRLVLLSPIERKHYILNHQTGGFHCVIEVGLYL